MEGFDLKYERFLRVRVQEQVCVLDRQFDKTTSFAKRFFGENQTVDVIYFSSRHKGSSKKEVSNYKTATASQTYRATQAIKRSVGRQTAQRTTRRSAPSREHGLKKNAAAKITIL